jgi:16S rRNA U516 pseudouridylate synthase RsuA-like enzyme
MSGTATGAAVVAATLTSCLCCVSVRMLRSSDVVSSTSDSVVDGDAVEVGAQTNKRLRSSEPMTDAGAGAGAATAPEEDSGVHLLMNKPPCCLSSTIDEQPQATRKTKLKRQRALGGAQQAQQQQQEQQASTAQPRSTVVEILRANGFDPATTSPVGRLDFESSGALLFTSDGCAYIASRPAVACA